MPRLVRPPTRKPAYGLQIPETSGRLRVISPWFVRAVVRAGLPVNVWIVNDEADIRRLLDWA